MLARLMPLLVNIGSLAVPTRPAREKRMVHMSNRRTHSRRALRERRRRETAPWLLRFSSLLGTNLNAGGWQIIVGLLSGLIGAVLFAVYVIGR